jgi:4-hydroxy-3-polyprenylbenzoate decarboxylase
MKYRDLRDFIASSNSRASCERVSRSGVSAAGNDGHRRPLLRAGGPAVLFTPRRLQTAFRPDQPLRHPRTGGPGHGRRVGVDLRDVGRLLAALKEPEPPKGLKDAGKLLHMAKAVWDMKPAVRRSAPCQEVVLEGDEVDLGRCRCRPAGRATPGR